MYNCAVINSEDQLRSFLEESLIMKDFKHRHVLSLLGVCFNTPDHSPYIILPFMANGSVKTYLRAKRVHPTNFDDCPDVSMCVVLYHHTKHYSCLLRDRNHFVCYRAFVKQISTKTSKLDSPNKHCVHVLSKLTSGRVCIYNCVYLQLVYNRD